jgi:pimeloyl-ACP methyl ester carboxylesterase
MEKIVLKTSDGLDIAGDYYPATRPSQKAVLLIHMMPADRTSWRDFAPKLVDKGFHVLAIDLRGHGESTGGPDGFQNFSDQEHQLSIKDLEAGAAFLDEKDVKKEGFVLIGASIGANLVIRYAADHPEVNGIVLLSPGFNYRGIEVRPFAERLRPGQRALFVGSEDDPQSNGVVLRTLAAAVPSQLDTKIIAYKAAGHGTNMFDKEKPDLSEEILKWLE